MPTVHTQDASLHVEVDGEGAPVTVFAHGLTNSRMEMAMLTPFLPGTKVRFDFRGHGKSSAPDTGYGFEDFGRDVKAVADTYAATRAVGTSLGQGAICNLLGREPGRFERLIFVLPAALDVVADDHQRFLETAEILETRSREQAIAELLDHPDRLEDYARAPWMRELAQQMWAESDPVAVARAIRGVLETPAVSSREQLRAVTAPTLILGRRNDPIHPIEVSEVLAEVMPNAELIAFDTDEDILAALPSLVERAAEFLA